MLLDQATALELTEPFHKIWLDAHESAWALWLEQLESNAEFVSVLESGDRFTILHRHIAKNVALEMQHASGVILPTLNFFAVSIEDLALVRFKHLDGDLKPRNFQTGQQADLGRQQYPEALAEQLKMEGISTLPTLLTCGFTLTPGEDELSRVVLVCRNPELRWSIDLRDLEDGTGSVDVQNFPGMPPVAPRISPTKAQPEESEDQG